ncbi:hypothetical protein [Burkholderia sp. WAC0059]|uniref:hypothetical protein n=1 Tax=Burkholderia sp. WAC0059 TaxID=2066022 RepID=UPI0011AECC99|nr:hypothetical protein [Burkholderia sp. WAC0059]
MAQRNVRSLKNRSASIAPLIAPADPARPRSQQAAVAFRLTPESSGTDLSHSVQTKSFLSTGIRAHFNEAE